MDEDEELEPAPEHRPGHVELSGEDHASHVYLYLPDLSSTTGWVAHQVPMPSDPPARQPRPVGFRPR